MNFAAKCKGCKAGLSINYIPKGVSTLIKKVNREDPVGEFGFITEKNSSSAVNMFLIDVRGVEVLDWNLCRTPLQFTSADGSTKYDPIVIEDYEEGYDDVDPKSFEPVSATEFVFSVDRV